MMRRGPSRLAVAAVLFGPALLVAGACAWWFGLPLRAQIASTEAQTRALQSSLPSAEEVRTAQDRAASLRAELAAIVSARRPRAAEDGLVFVPTPERAQWRLLLSDTLNRHHLMLLAEERTVLDLPASIARGLTGSAAARSQVAAWSLELRGGYLDLLAAVAELRSAELPFHLLELQVRSDGPGQVKCKMVVG